MPDVSYVKIEKDDYNLKDSRLRNKIQDLNADDVSFDNTSSTLVSDTVQEAIDDILTSLTPTLIVSVESDSSIQIILDSIVIRGTSSDGNFSTSLPSLGTWTVMATKNGRTVQAQVNVDKIGKTYNVSLEYFSATLTINTYSGATVYVNGNGYNLSNVATGGVATFTLQKSGNYVVDAKYNGINSEVKTITASIDGESLSENINFIILQLTAPENSDIEITDGTTTITGTGSGTVQEYLLPNIETWTATAELDGKTTSDSIVVSSYQTYTMELSFTHIYGIEWAGTSDPACTRTDDSALFVDPVPYMADDNHPGSSPFDTLMPWSGMVKETIGRDVFVKIPKFWFKITKNGTKRKIQIADKALDGFMVSPAHQDRGDGKGERDYVYVSRYHVNSEYKSKSGVYPLTNTTRLTVRSNCAGRGTGYCQFDMMTLITIWYLYLVEFAHWDSQSKIGRGCNDRSDKRIVGASDSMPYHTGTMKSSRTSYGVGTQYRWIEDLWGNVFDWVDGIYFSDTGIYAIKNPANFSDTTGGTKVGFYRTRTTNEIKSWGNSSVSGYEWFTYPNSVYDDPYYATYCCDKVSYSSSGVVLYFGSDYRYSQQPHSGLFSLGDAAASTSADSIGARLLYLP